eukprot:c16988_g1_i3.p1 GENE.c16988_g1_i3~~c16988_g1_i3.p1  ORF type:complete len:318 (+),score=39.22 c16988_g1_i3:109-954(+)
MIPVTLTPHAEFAHTPDSHTSYAIGLQQGLDDFWKTFKMASVAGFGAGMKQGQAEVTAKFEKSYVKSYSASFHLGRNSAHSDKAQDELVGRSPPSGGNPIENAPAKSSTSKASTGGGGSGSQGGSGSGQATSSTDTDTGSTAPDSGSGGSEGPAADAGMDNPDMYDMNYDSDNAKQEQDARDAKARDTANEGGAVEKVPADNVGSVQYQMLLQRPDVSDEQELAQTGLTNLVDRWSLVTDAPTRPDKTAFELGTALGYDDPFENEEAVDLTQPIHIGSLRG